MRPALILIDLQQDYLFRPRLQPARQDLVPLVADLLNTCRQSAIPVYHAITLVRPDGSNRMPHWQRENRMACVEGSPGVLPPPELNPLPNEAMIPKPFFSAFGNPQLDESLQAQDIDTVILAGIYTHACVRTTALDAYSRGYQVIIAADAVGSDDPTHATMTLDYLSARVARCLKVAEIAQLLRAGSSKHRIWRHHNPARWEEVLAEVSLASAAEVAESAHRALQYAPAWRQTAAAQRSRHLQSWLASMTGRRQQLIAMIVREVGKPLLDAAAEFDYALALLRHGIDLLESATPENQGSRFSVRNLPWGVVGIITPWNNPLAIPVGKLCPALGFGNTVVWKPAMQATQTALIMMDCLNEAGLSEAVMLVTGDADTGRQMVSRPEIQAVSFTGSMHSGRQVVVQCGLHQKLLQAEMGGNNAVLVMADVDVAKVARQLAPAIFSFSGQRCTAPRRIIVAEPVKNLFEQLLVEVTQALVVGEPARQGVQVGPLISRHQQQRMLDLVENGTAAGGKVLCGGTIPHGLEHGCWFSPTLIADPDPDSLSVQQEGFGPLAVIQSAQDFEHAIALANSTQYGLAATLFSNDRALQDRFIHEAQAGILAINQTPLVIDPMAPFFGWKASGVGLPEHGRWDRDFYTRPQAFYP